MAENKELLDGQVGQAESDRHELDVPELAEVNFADLKYPNGFSSIVHESRVETVLGLVDESKRQISKSDGSYGPLSRSFWTAV
jgi:hypothetical protein